MKISKEKKVKFYEMEVEMSDEKKLFLKYAKENMTKADLEHAKLCWAMYDCVKIMAEGIEAKKGRQR